jgi:hypothetical protein
VLIILTLAGAFTLLVAGAVDAKPNSPPPGHVKNGKVSHSAPAPVLGVGLPALAVYGGYVWYRRRQRKAVSRHTTLQNR